MWLVDLTKSSIVFVHGLYGDREATWTHSQTNVFWPKDLLPGDIKDARILSFGYDAKIVKWAESPSDASIEMHAGSLAARLVGFRGRTQTVRPTFYHDMVSESCSSHVEGTFAHHLCRT